MVPAQYSSSEFRKFWNDYISLIESMNRNNVVTNATFFLLSSFYPFQVWCPVTTNTFSNHCVISHLQSFNTQFTNDIERIHMCSYPPLCIQMWDSLSCPVIPWRNYGEIWNCYFILFLKWPKRSGVRDEEIETRKRRVDRNKQYDWFRKMSENTYMKTSGKKLISNERSAEIVWSFFHWKTK